MINGIDILGALIAFVALLFSISNSLRVRKLENVQIKLSEIELQEKREEQNRKNKASCDVNIVKVSTGTYILKLFNKGESKAKEIMLKFTSEEKLDIEMDLRNPNFPVKELEPQKNIDYYIFSNDATKGPWEYFLEWLNEDGTKGTKIGILTMPMT